MNKTKKECQQTKVLFFILSFCAILVLPAISFAQDLPCGGDSDDPFDQATCPLDTWVFVLAAVAIVFAIIHLHKKPPSGIPRPISC